MVELMDCPFCGSSSVSMSFRDNRDAWVHCENCGGRGAYVKITVEEIRDTAERRAADAWNRRPHGRA